MTDTEVNRPGAGTLQSEIIEMMAKKSEPTDLWTRDEVMIEMGLIEKRQAENALYNAWRGGKIFRHKEQNEDKQFRYALKIKETDRQSPGLPATGVNSGSGTKKRRGAMPTAKEIRMDFAEIQRLMARLEDKVMTVTEHSEETDKQLNKLKNLF